MGIEPKYLPGMAQDEARKRMEHPEMFETQVFLDGIAALEVLIKTRNDDAQEKLFACLLEQQERIRAGNRLTGADGILFNLARQLGIETRDPNDPLRVLYETNSIALYG